MSFVAVKKELNYNNMENELNELKKDFEIKHWNNYMDYVESLPKVKLTEEMKKDIEDRLGIIYSPINLDSAPHNN
jgi:hypothetical protein